MPFSKELSHLIEEQITRAVDHNTTVMDSTGSGSGSGVDEGRMAQVEANLQKLAEKFTDFLSSQKDSKRNVVDYGLEVIALHELRLAITAGRATFIDNNDPLDVPYTFLQLTSAGTERQIRYIYLDSSGVVLESTTDPTNIGTGYLPLAIIDVWTGITEITQDKIKDIRPRVGAQESNSNTQNNYLLNGNATLYSPDTGNDSFIVSAANPAGLKVNVTSGRALVAGEMLNAEGGLLDVTNHCNIIKEFITFSDGTTKTFNLYHRSVADVTIYVDDVAETVNVDAANGSITFTTAPIQDAKITASYTFSGNYLLVFLVETAQTNEGNSFGVINWKVGSNRTPAIPPDLATYQHAIAKVDMSSAIMAITDSIIDNSYEVKNLTQYDLQYGGKLDGSSLQYGAISLENLDPSMQSSIAEIAQTKDAIGLRVKSSDFNGQNIVSQINVSPAGTLIDGKLLHVTGKTVFESEVIVESMLKAGSISAAKIAAGAITADKISATLGQISGQLTAGQIATGAVTTDKISANLADIKGQLTAGQLATGSITADKLNVTLAQISGKLTASQIDAGVISADKITTGILSADLIYQAGYKIKNCVMQKGTIANGGTIPLPSGYTVDQCIWGVLGGVVNSAVRDSSNNQYMTPSVVSVDINRVVTASASFVLTSGSGGGYVVTIYGSAYYWIMGVK